MKYKVLQLDEHGRISFTKEELEKLLDEVYEEGRKDANYYWYKPYWTYTTSDATITTNPNKSIDKWTITVGDGNQTNGTYSAGHTTNVTAKG